MKRTFCLFLIMVMVLCLLPVQTMATGKEITYYPDGSYTVVEIFQQSGRAAKSVTGSKSSSHYGSSGNLVWKATLTGSFSYTGASATCTSASASVTVYDSSWYTVSKSTSKSGNTAKGSVTMNRKLNGVTAKSVTENLSLSCSASGKLS